MVNLFGGPKPHLLRKGKERRSGSTLSSAATRGFEFVERQAKAISPERIRRIRWEVVDIKYVV